MQELTVFQNDQFGEIRTVERDGEPWFVAADVCRVLELSDTGRATERLEEDELTRIKIESGGQLREMIAVNEPGLYSLIIGSRKQEARMFKHWITHEVIPSIRKHGAYATANVIDQVIADPAYGIRLLETLKAEKDKNAMLQPKADYFDALVDRNLLTSIRETAKELHIPERKFTKYLTDNHYLYRDNKNKLQPFAEHVEAGLFVLKECKNDKNKWSGTQTLITPKGRETLRLLLSDAA